MAFTSLAESACETGAGAHMHRHRFTRMRRGPAGARPPRSWRRGEQMPAATTARIGFSDEEFVRLIETLKDADSVELKLTVPESNQRSTAVALELDPLDAQIRQVFFFDTPDLALDAAG